MFENIGIDFKVERNAIREILSDVFSGVKIHYFDMYDTWEIEDEELLDDSSICFSLTKSESEFPIKLILTRTSEEHTEEREQFLAKTISDRLACKTIANYSYPGHPENYPSDSIIFEKGRAYLADDSKTIWGDGEGGPVQIVKEIEFHVPQFDDRGRFVSGSS